LYSQTTGSLRGTVTDTQTTRVLPGATVTIKESSLSVITDSDGHYIFPGIKAGKIYLVVSFVGYESFETPVTISPRNPTIVNVSLQLEERVGNEVVVSASNHAEKIINAPASVHVIGTKQLEQFAGSNVGELASKIQGLEFVRTGIDFVAFNARGFNRAINNKFFQMVDGRNTMSPLSPGLPLVNIATANKEDIERIEIILGPQSALFGPNVHNGLFYITSKDPRKYQGTTVALSAGNRYQFSTRLRHATVINSKWAYKIVGEYASGKDFTLYDSVYDAGGGRFGDSVTIPERNVDFDFRHVRGEAHAYYSVTKKADIILSGGGSENNFIGVSNNGRNQMKGIRNGFLQARFIHPNFFVNIYNMWGSFGSAYSIAGYTRSFWNLTHTTPPMSVDSAEKLAMRPFVEKSQRLNAEAQYNYSFQKQGLFLVAGLTYQREKPNSYGNGLVDATTRIRVTQVGAVLQLEKLLPWSLRLVGAARLDNHSNYGNFISPKIGLLKNVGKGTFRITWAKGYAMPSILFQYSNGSNLVFGNGRGIKYIPNLSKYSEANYETTTALKPEQINTWELGYKGNIAKKVYIDISCYNGLSKHFLSPSIPVQGRVFFVGDVPVVHNPAAAGKVVNDTLDNATFFTFFNYGDVRSYGIDLGVTFSFSKIISFAMTYSWFGSDITNDDPKNDANDNGYVAADEKSLNAPKNRGAATLSFQNLLKQRAFVNISTRLVQEYDFYSGSQLGTAEGKGKRGVIYQGPNVKAIMANFDRGPLGGFVTIDLSAGYSINNMVAVNAGVTNVFNTNQAEFVGSPSIGRLIMVEVKVHVPNSNKD